MKTVYVMWNYDNDEALFASEDKELVQEMMYDFMIEDAHFKHNFCSYPIKDIIEDTWEYYCEFITIIEIPVVN